MEQQNTTTAAPAAEGTQSSTTFIQNLRNGEQHWAWKIGLRTTLCVLDIIGLGVTAALAVASSSIADNAFYGFSELDWFYLPGALAAVRFLNPPHDLTASMLIVVF
jgi:hypothetical protein